MPVHPHTPSRFPVICGPTAGGKSTLAVALAQLLRDRHAIPAEIVAADAFQIYRGMDIGTAKPTHAERAGIPHHLIDLVEPTDTFTVQQWLAAAERCIADLRARGVLPIVVGGTHLYVKALLEGLFEGPPPDAALRQQLAALDPAVRRAELERVDPAAAARIHPNDERRTIRALEIHRQTGRPISDHQTQWDQARHRPDALLVMLDWPTDAINRRINARVMQMIDAGLVNEVAAIRSGPGFGPQAREALGYRQVLEWMNAGAARGAGGAIGLHQPPGSIGDDVIERIKIDTRRLAKSQRTWLKRLRTTPGLLSIDATALGPEQWPDLVTQAVFLT